MADLEQAFTEFDPRQRRRVVNAVRFEGLIRGLERIAGQYVLDISQHQFLVLLLMIQAKFQQRENFSPGPIIGIHDQGFHGHVHVAAIGVDVLQRRA